MTMITDPDIDPPAPLSPLTPLIPQGVLGALWWQGLRTLFLMRPQWPAQPITPAVLAVLVMVAMATSAMAERLFIVGAAYFYWPAVLGSWFPTVAAIWACWLAAERRAEPGAASLFALISAQALPAAMLGVLLLVPIYRSEDFAQSGIGRWLGGWAWFGMLAWFSLAHVLVLWRSGQRSVLIRMCAAMVLVGGSLLQLWMDPVRHWYPMPEAEAQASEDASPKPFQLSQEDTEVQTRLLQQKLQALRTPMRGQAGLYAITFAPYADEDVFKRESELVASVMQERFGATGRTIQLVNHRDTLRQWPWATPLNLQRTIRHMGRVMNRDDDVLFIHLTSHGASDGVLAAEFAPLAMEPVTPAKLRRWLDEAGIRWRVISISACYSGSWIPALADANTLVMTAADADHTSYGCGRKSHLTFFGRAMYDEQLRQHRSFEQAHAAARPVIERREREAGKDDGYSNPQIRVGEAIRTRLQQLEQTLAR